MYKPMNELMESVPEYYSGSKIVSWLFHKRLTVAADFVRELQPKRLVDIGCGDGTFLRLVSGMGIELHGTDIKKSVIELGNELNNCLFSVQDLRNTSFDDGTFDVVVCLDTLEHIEDLPSAMHEFKRIMKKPGYLITSEPTESWIYKILRFILKGTFSKKEDAGLDYHFHDARGVDRKVVGAGFERVKSVKIPVPFPFDLFHLNLYRVR